MTEAVEGFEQRLHMVDATRWSASTPCGEWDVRTLVNHVVAELLWVPPLLDGKTITEVGDRFEGDILNDDPLAAWMAAVPAALVAASQPGAQEQTVHLSFGDFPGTEYLAQVTSDVVIHSWDLARAVGAVDRLHPMLVEFVDDFLSPQVDAWRSAGAFGPAVEIGPDVNPQDRLLAQTGRSPTWTS